MTFSMRRFSAIFRKELQDFKTNSQTLIMMAMPVFLQYYLVVQTTLEKLGQVH